MKKVILLSTTLIASLLLVSGCAEDNHGRIDQLDKDLPAPQPVEVTGVKPTSGGAVLWVRIPDDKNIKGVVATYNVAEWKSNPKSPDMSIAWRLKASLTPRNMRYKSAHSTSMKINQPLSQSNSTL